MSNTIPKELTKELAELKKLSYEELEAKQRELEAERLKIATVQSEKKHERIITLQQELNDLLKLVSAKEEEIAELLPNEGLTKKGKGGHKKAKAAKPVKVKKGKGKRDTGLKETILDFLRSKGKAGAHVDEIAKHADKPKANINAFLASTGKKHGVKGKGKRSGIYFLK
jgi:hypothetical protein